MKKTNFFDKSYVISLAFGLLLAAIWGTFIMRGIDFVLMFFVGFAIGLTCIRYDHWKQENA